MIGDKRSSFVVPTIYIYIYIFVVVFFFFTKKLNSMIGVA